MNAPDLIRTIRETPFEPLILKFTGGHRELVKHADNIMVIGSSVYIAQHAPAQQANEDDDVPAWAKKYSLRHLVSVAPAGRASA